MSRGREMTSFFYGVVINAILFSVNNIEERFILINGEMAFTFW
ncbi:hypothetical protein [Bacillus cereus]